MNNWGCGWQARTQLSARFVDSRPAVVFVLLSLLLLLLLLCFCVCPCICVSTCVPVVCVSMLFESVCAPCACALYGYAALLCMCNVAAWNRTLGDRWHVKAGWCLVGLYGLRLAGRVVARVKANVLSSG